MKFPLQRLLWADCMAGGCVGFVGLALTLKGLLGPALGLPVALLVMIGCANLLYAAYSLSIALAVHQSVARIQFLIRANFAWAIACVVMASTVFGTAKLLGLSYLLVEAAFVGLLAHLESGALKHHLAESKNH